MRSLGARVLKFGTESQSQSYAPSDNQKKL